MRENQCVEKLTKRRKKEDGEGEGEIKDRLVNQTRKRRTKGRCRWQGRRRKCRREDRKEGIKRRWEETKRGIIF